MRRWWRARSGKRRESVAETLGKIRFEPTPVETLYLDEARVHEDFIGQVGALEAFTRLATREGNVGLETPVLKIDAGVGASSEAGVTWNLSHPIVQVLILRTVLKKQDLLHELDNSQPGHYIVFSGAGMISRPGMFDDLHRERLKDLPDLYENLEAERALQEREMRDTGGPNEYLWLLTLNNGDCVCAATLLGSLLRPSFRHWAHVDSQWEIIGLCRRIHGGTKVPWLAPLHLRAKFECVQTAPRDTVGSKAARSDR